MFIRTKKSSRNAHTYVQIVESYREHGRMKQRMLKHIGTARTAEELVELKRIAEVVKAELKQQLSSGATAEKEASYASVTGCLTALPKQAKVTLSSLTEQTRHTLGIHDVYGAIFDTLGFNQLLKQTKRQQRATALLRDMVLARIAKPMSKRASVEWLNNHCGVNAKLEQVYRMMDKLDEAVLQRAQDCALEAAKQLSSEPMRVMFYDVTTLYFESFTEDELKENGYSKDMKFNQPQVLLALLVTEAGLPVGYEVFSGSTFEGHTFKPVLEKLKCRYNIDDVVIVADRGMLNKTNIDYLHEQNIYYIVGARIKNMAAGQKQRMLDWVDTLDKGAMNEEVTHRIVLNKEQQLILSYRPARARKDQLDREKAIKKLQTRLKRSKNPKQLIAQYGFQKFISVQGEARLHIDEDKLKEQVRWDGLVGFITNHETLSNEQVLTQYRGLWQVEESFRICKSDLRMRPIYHWTPKRIKAHIAIAFIALTCVRYLAKRLAIQKHPCSPERIRESLLQVQASIIQDQAAQKRYLLPAPINTIAKQLYQLCHIKLPKNIMLITN